MQNFNNLELTNEELEKSENSPIYFYNKYVRKEGQKELTEKEYEEFVKQVEYKRNTPPNSRNYHTDRPLTPNQCYKMLPNSFIN